MSATVGQQILGRLRFPQLFVVLAVLFLADLVVPDLIPFADELILGALTALVGSLRRPRPAAQDPAAGARTAGKPPQKNITPRA